MRIKRFMIRQSSDLGRSEWRSAHSEFTTSSSDQVRVLRERTMYVLSALHCKVAIEKNVDETHLRTKVEDEDRVVQVVDLLSRGHLCCIVLLWVSQEGIECFLAMSRCRQLNRIVGQ